MTARKGTSSSATWLIEQEGFDPAREHAVESLFTLGNGYLGVRGALETPLAVSQADLFIAGIYDRKRLQRPYSEPEFLHVGDPDYPYTELVSVPFPFRLQLTVEGQRLDLANPGWHSHRRVLDMRAGTLHSETRFSTNRGRDTVLRTRRCASMADRHLLLHEIQVTFENHSGGFVLDTALADPALALNHPHLVSAPPVPASVIDVQRYRTRASGYEICMAARTTRVGAGEDAVSWSGSATIGEALTFRRYIVIYTSRDVADPGAAALAHLQSLPWEDFDRAWAAHAAAWEPVWHAGDVQIVDGGRPAERAMRFHVYHLCSTADHDPEVSVGARALSGRAYEGHIFWDVEMFMLPFYLHTCPEVARSLLRYRHHTLDGARRRARGLGYAGACYAWESTVTGDDVTPRELLLKTSGKQIPIFTGQQQIHVTADVAFGVWHYFDTTHDDAFLRDYGAEILIDTARFWVSRCVREGDRYHIRGVVGPDEYHSSVDDNAYTNWMARFNLEKAAWVWTWLRRYPEAAGQLTERLEIRADEAGEWAAVAAALYCPQPGADGVIEQFAGFFDLADYPLGKEERFRTPVSRLFEWDKINRLKLLKQADVLMLPHLFPRAFTDEVVLANYRYYEPLTDHGSSLSPAIHAAIAARLGLYDDAVRYWRQSLWLDLSNVMDNSALGIHAACMGGTWQALVFGFLGVHFTDDGPVLDPAATRRLPPGWQQVRLQLAWRGHRYPLVVEREEER